MFDGRIVHPLRNAHLIHRTQMTGIPTRFFDIAFVLDLDLDLPGRLRIDLKIRIRLQPRKGHLRTTQQFKCADAFLERFIAKRLQVFIDR